MLDLETVGDYGDVLSVGIERHAGRLCRRPPPRWFDDILFLSQASSQQREYVFVRVRSESTQRETRQEALGLILGCRV